MIRAIRYLVFTLLGLTLIINSGCATKHKPHSSTADLQESHEAMLSSTGDFVLGAEDVIEILVWKNDALSRQVFVRPDGKISLPIIGELQAAGLTPTQLRDSIKERLQEYKETPEVSVIIREVNSYAVFVLGEVAHPGKLQLRSKTTLLQALSLAGGFTQYADTSGILLLRRSGGGEERIRISYSDIIKGKNTEGNLLLQRGDTILVP
ncbi:MAG: polysaccharide biosynthesis/export family protein [Nitrospirae bacterium]|nr:polysaccharide biosynthesis/export family protein [Candidatus Manganitrophaceae bacterium]